MDKTYKERLTLRQSLLAQYPTIVVGVTPAGQKPESPVHAAITELYEFIVGVYLPTRYPSMFTLETTTHTQSQDNTNTNNRESTNKTLLNKITNTRIPLPHRGSGRDMLSTLGTFVDEDFLVLLPESSPAFSYPTEEEKEEEKKYTLEAYTTFYPAGFDTREKLGKRLSTIHDPVPRYKERLEKSMDRFFARLEVGKVVQRVNWSINTKGTGLFAAFGGLHGHEGEKGERVLGVEEVDGEGVCYLISFPFDFGGVGKKREKGQDSILTMYRLFFGVSVRLYIGYRRPRRWCSRSIRIRTLSGRSRKKDWVRNWRWRLMG